MLLAALAAMAVSLLLAALILLPVAKTGKGAGLGDDVLHWTTVVVTALVMFLSVYMVLMFLSSARSLYTSYLEAFEQGFPLRKPSKLPQGSEPPQEPGEGRPAQSLERPRQ